MREAPTLFGMPVRVRRDMPEGVVFALVGKSGVALMKDGAIEETLQTGPNEYRSVAEVFRDSL